MCLRAKTLKNARGSGHLCTLVDLFRPVPDLHDEVHPLEDARDGRVRYLLFHRASIIATWVDESQAHTSLTEAIGDAHLLALRHAVPDEKPDAFSSLSQSAMTTHVC